MKTIEHLVYNVYISSAVSFFCGVCCEDLVALTEQMAAGAMEDCALKAWSDDMKERHERQGEDGKT